jgi:hypothetical protein
MNWRIAGGGYGIHWPDLDEDLSIEGLLRGAQSSIIQDLIVENLSFALRFLELPCFA